MDSDQAYLVTQFMILHRSRGQGFNGPLPITLQDCQAFLAFWPQWDELKFVETVLAADQLFLNVIHQELQEDKA